MEVAPWRWLLRGCRRDRRRRPGRLRGSVLLPVALTVALAVSLAEALVIVPAVALAVPAAVAVDVFARGRRAHRFGCSIWRTLSLFQLSLGATSVSVHPVTLATRGGPLPVGCSNHDPCHTA